MAKHYWPFNNEGERLEDIEAKAPVFDVAAFNARYAGVDAQFSLTLGVRDDVPVAVLQDTGEEIIGILICHRRVTDGIFSPALNFKISDLEVCLLFDEDGWHITHADDDPLVSSGYMLGGFYRFDGELERLTITNFAGNEVKQLWGG